MTSFRYCIAIAAAIFMAHGANAQNTEKWPARVVRIVIPYTPGGPGDAVLRAVAVKLQDKWGQPVIIDNRPGANEIIGAALVAKSPADGYTIFAGTESSLTMNQFLYSNLPYNTEKDFEPITRVLEVPLALFVTSALPVKTAGDFISFAKNSKIPLTYASSGTGGFNHLPAIMLEKTHGFELNYIVYKGIAPAMVDLLGGTVQVSMMGAGVIEPHVKKGTLRALAVASDSRLPSLPDTPTLKELRLNDFGASYSYGLLAPKGTAKAIIKEISDSVIAIIKDPDFQKQQFLPLSIVATPYGPEEYGQYLKANARLQKERIATSGVKLN